MKLFRMLLISFSMILFITNLAEAQHKKLTYEQVFLNKGEKIIGTTPSLIGWYDSENYLQSIVDDSLHQIVKVNASSGESEVLIDFNFIEENLPEDIKLKNNYKISDDYSAMVITTENNLHYYRIDNNEYRQLTFDEDEEVNPNFSPDNNYIAYTKERNLFYYDLAEGKEYQLTTDASDVIYNGYASWVYYEEILGRAGRYKAFWWSPNSKYIVFLRFDDSPVPKFPLYNSRGKHGSLEWEHYPKAGDPLPVVKLGIVSTGSKEISWIDVDSNDDHMVAWSFWSTNSEQLLFQWLNRDHNNLKIYSADPITGVIKEIYDEKQNSWIEFFKDIYCFEDNSGFIIRSDISGWSHLYYYDYDGNLINTITEGDFAVKSISYVDETNREIYFTGSINESTANYLYKIKIAGTELVRLTKDEGSHSPNISPNAKYFYDSFNSISQPAVINLYNSDGSFLREIGNSKFNTFEEYALPKTELFRIPSGDGFDLPIRWILPNDFDESRKYPVLFKVYGGPGSQSVRNSFPRLPDLYYAQEGIIIISVDHRGSGHFGKNGMSLMHRNLGKWEMHDYITAVNWLKEKSFVDSTKIGITGGSYGGYVTCLALTKGSNYFTHGLADFSVTDWHLYDNVYTERYMDTPEENPEGYEAGSVLNYVDNYKGLLRITHGTLDDNVHMQNTIQLVDKLTDANKNFELMIYPGQRHGIRGAKRAHAIRETNQFWFKHFLNKDIKGTEKK
ncbi:MAG TPA: S9 family peptidase [Ignavibacteria bacterium]|nr:S9 family peptidase [Ignavibacteria bacterium]